MMRLLDNLRGIGSEVCFGITLVGIGISDLRGIVSEACFGTTAVGIDIPVVGMGSHLNRRAEHTKVGRAKIVTGTAALAAVCREIVFLTHMPAGAGASD